MTPAQLIALWSVANPDEEMSKEEATSNLMALMRMPVAS